MLDDEFSSRTQLRSFASDGTIPVDPVIEAYKKDVDRGLIQHNLELTVEERLNNLMKLQEFAAELQRAGREATAKR
jgi:hypothetical protein